MYIELMLAIVSNTVVPFPLCVRSHCTPTARRSAAPFAFDFDSRRQNVENVFFNGR
jgi:hypothetical protein